MRCLPCSLASPPGGTSYAIREAVAVCRECGAGLCPEHLQRAAATGPCRCPGCAGNGTTA